MEYDDLSPGRKLAFHRKKLDLTVEQMARELYVFTQRLGFTPVESESMKRYIQRWENDKVHPDEHHLRLLTDFFHLSPSELGFSTDSLRLVDVDEAFCEEMNLLIDRSASITSGDIDALSAMTENFRKQDSLIMGMGFQAISEHISRLEALLEFQVLSKNREQLAYLLSDTAALAGWQALDAGQYQRASRHFSIARSAGYQAGDAAVLAHALGEHSFALADIGRVDLAHTLLDEALSLSVLPPVMQAWLYAAKAEMYAHQGQRDLTQKAFDQAQVLLPENSSEGSVPFVVLDSTHLDRWHGHALTLLGDPEATLVLEKVLHLMGDTYVRARCGLLVDLATSYQIQGNDEAYRENFKHALRLARTIKSQRNLKKLHILRHKNIQN